MINVYGDDGADEKKERVISISALGASESEWRDVEQKWIERCNGVPFHAVDCESDQGDYRGRPHKENKLLYRDLTTILAESFVGGVAIAVDLTAQREMFPYSLEMAYYRAFIEVLSGCARLGQIEGDIVELTFDISSENEFNAALLYGVMRDGDEDFVKWLHPRLSFVPWRDSARVQMADLLAYEGWKALDHAVGPINRTRRSWQALVDTERFKTICMGKNWFDGLKRHIESGQLERKVGFNQGDYVEWLNQKRRQHNLSNFFHFIDWIRKRDEQ